MAIAGGATARLKPGKQAGPRSGRPWVYRGEIEAVQGAPVSGDLVAVTDAYGQWLGWAFYHETSVLALRLLGGVPGEVPGDAFFERRLAAAVAYRREVLGPEAFGDEGACRLVFAEADGLPGLIVDKFGPVLVCQVLTAGIERRLAFLSECLAALTGSEVIFARNEGAVRRLEGLSQRSGPLRGTPPDIVPIREGAVLLGVDLRAGQKTGHFLDQRENRLLFGGLIRALGGGNGAEATTVPGAGSAALPTVLDCFCHSGGFGLQALAAGAARVLFVDTQTPALEAVRRNAQMNGFEDWEVQQANAFDLLRALEREGRQFAAVVLDPPAFARARAQLDGAYRGYKEINLRAMRLLAPGGLLCTSSCSQAVSEEMFDAMLRDAAADAGRRLRVIARRGAPPDHPGLLGADETAYLKCRFLQALA